MLTIISRLSPILQPTVKEISELLLTKYVKGEESRDTPSLETYSVSAND